MTREEMVDRIARLVEIGTNSDVEPEPGDNEFTHLDQDEANELEALRKALRDQS